MKNIIRQFYLSLRRLAYRPKIKKHIQGTGNQLNINANIHQLTIAIQGNNNEISFAPSATISNLTIYMNGNNQQIHIADNCYIGQAEFWLEDDNVMLKMGAQTTIEQAHLAVTENGSQLIIGEDCMLARNIEIRTGDSHAIYNSETNQRINPAQNITIENHVWVGSGAKILKGSHLKAGSVVATGAIVTGKVPENCIASGIPAKVIKQNIHWTRQR